MSIITVDEARLRADLDEAIVTMSQALERCPALDGLHDEAAVHEAAALLAQATTSMQDALRITEALERLESATADVVLLVTSSRIALGVVREALALLTAEMDCLSDAA